MSDGTSKNVNVEREPLKDSAKLLPMAVRTGLFALFLICSLAVFLIGPKHYPLFPTNGNIIYAGCLSVVFLIAALLLKRSGKTAKFWMITYAFFVASVVNLITILFGDYNETIIQFFGVKVDTNQFMAFSKLYEAMMAVIPILVLTWVSGADLGSLFLKKGNMDRKWGLGIGTLVLFNFLTSALIFFGTGYEASKLGSAILWGVLFSLFNSMLEELWVRGLFLKILVPVIGATGAILLTSIGFASLHFLSVAYLPATVVPIFVINTFTLGLACSILMLKTDSIWGAFLIHAAADLFLFIATLAVH
jgi:membrane protease YdiL (CAAX protease family)